MSYPFPPFPPRGDRPGWAEWWRHWNEINNTATDAELIGGLFPPVEDEDLPEGVSTLAEAVDEALAGIDQRREKDGVA
jgi:hypothetical protein